MNTTRPSFGFVEKNLIFDHIGVEKQFWMDLQSETFEADQSRVTTAQNLEVASTAT